MQRIVQEVSDLLSKKGLTLGLIESASGGLISNLITNISGSSAYYKGAITAYSNQTKVNLVGVKQGTIDKYGAVSSQVVEEMAKRGRDVLDADICLATTGIAGPHGATKSKPVGLFYIGLSNYYVTLSRKYQFKGNRRQNKKAAGEAAMSLLREYIL